MLRALRSGKDAGRLLCLMPKLLISQLADGAACWTDYEIARLDSADTVHAGWYSVLSPYIQTWLSVWPLHGMARVKHS